MEKVIALALICTACGNVEGLRAQDIYALQNRTHTWVYGLVTNARTGAPLAGVTVLIGGRSTTTEGDGTYRIEGLAAIEATGSASVHGFQTTSLFIKLDDGANLRDFSLEPNECGRYACTPGEFCAGTQCVTGAVLTGAVLSSCNDLGIDALVMIDGKATCSVAFKGAIFRLEGLTPGGPHTISIGKTGYSTWLGQIALNAGLNTLDPVKLTPARGCGAPPEPMACSCTSANCQP